MQPPHLERVRTTSPVTSLVTHHPADDCISYYVINHMRWINSLITLPSLNSETFSFMLTGEDGSRRFGYCRRLLVSCCPTPHPLLTPCWAQLVPTDMWYTRKTVGATQPMRQACPESSGNIMWLFWDYNPHTCDCVCKMLCRWLYTL